MSAPDGRGLVEARELVEHFVATVMSEDSHLAAIDRDAAITRLDAALRARDAQQAEEVERARADAVAAYAYTVDDPRRAHLHYDGCPYKPWADVPDCDDEESRPACTCAEAHKGAYWKGQWMLERGYKSIVTRDRDALAERVAALETLMDDLVTEHDETYSTDGCGYDECPWDRVRAALLATPKEETTDG